MLPFVDSAEYVSRAREGPRKQLQTAYYRQTPPETPRRGVSYISDLLDNFGSGGRDRTYDQLINSLKGIFSRPFSLSRFLHINIAKTINYNLIFYLTFLCNT